MCFASSAVSLSVCGINSCSGGSSKRIVTGRPFIASKIPIKSFFCNGKIFLRASFLCSCVSEAIIALKWISLSLSKNMCSVRQRPIPSAPKLKAFLASFGWSALARTEKPSIFVPPIFLTDEFLISSHQPKKVFNSAEISGSIRSSFPS